MVRRGWLRGRGVLAVAVAVLAAGACDGLLDVQDLDRFTSDDIDSALDAVAAGVEGDLHRLYDTYVIYQGLLSDELQHTGTWTNYDDVDHGRFIYANNGMETTYQQLLQARWFALDAQSRFERVLEGEAATSPLTSQVQMTGALADLLLGMAFCEAPAVPSGSAVSDTDILQQAVTKFTTAIATAQAAGATDDVYHQLCRKGSGETCSWATTPRPRRTRLRCRTGGKS